MDLTVGWAIGILVTILVPVLGGLSMWINRIDERVFHLKGSMVTREELVSAFKEVKDSVTELGRKIDRLMETKEDKEHGHQRDRSV